MLADSLTLAQRMLHQAAGSKRYGGTETERTREGWLSFLFFLVVFLSFCRVYHLCPSLPPSLSAYIPEVVEVTNENKIGLLLAGKLDAIQVRPLPPSLPPSLPPPPPLPPLPRPSVALMSSLPPSLPPSQIYDATEPVEILTETGHAPRFLPFLPSLGYAQAIFAHPTAWATEGQR